MSRTYRKTKKKQGSPKRSQTHFNRYQLMMQDVPLPPPIQLRYETVTEKVMVYGSITAPQDPKDPRWCTKGQPGAITEMVQYRKETKHYRTGEVIWWWAMGESGRYFLPTQDKTVEKTRRRLVRTPIDWLSTSWRDQWEHQRVFHHVHTNTTGNSRKRSTNRFNKREGVRRLRRESSERVRLWENEYHLNEHLLPYSWVLDDEGNPWEDYCFYDYDPDPDDYLWDTYDLSDDDHDDCRLCRQPTYRCRCDDQDDREYADYDYGDWY